MLPYLIFSLMNFFTEEGSDFNFLSHFGCNNWNFARNIFVIQWSMASRVQICRGAMQQGIPNAKSYFSSTCHLWKFFYSVDRTVPVFSCETAMQSLIRDGLSKAMKQFDEGMMSQMACGYWCAAMHARDWRGAHEAGTARSFTTSRWSVTSLMSSCSFHVPEKELKTYAISFQIVKWLHHWDKNLPRQHAKCKLEHRKWKHENQSTNPHMFSEVI